MTAAPIPKLAAQAPKPEAESPKPAAEGLKPVPRPPVHTELWYFVFGRAAQ